MRWPAVLLLGAVTAVVGYVGAWQLSVDNSPPPDYTLHLPPTTVSYRAPCAVQAGRWYRATGQTDLTALSGAQAALLNVQMQGGDPSALSHASLLLTSASATAAKDPPPGCIDKHHAWTAMVNADRQAAPYLYMDDTADATPLTFDAIADLRILKAELPRTWYPRRHRHHDVAATAPAGPQAGVPQTEPAVLPGRPGHSSPAAPAAVTTAGPPDSSCPVLGATGVYYTPATHKRDLLRCEEHTTASGTRREWRITGH